MGEYFVHYTTKFAALKYCLERDEIIQKIRKITALIWKLLQCSFFFFSREVDSDGDEIPEDQDVREYDGYRVWYSVEVTVRPPPAERVIPVTCACQVQCTFGLVQRRQYLSQLCRFANK